MTHDILQTDIDLARKLLDAGRSTAEIIAALGYRGIYSHCATQLVTDLQSGKKVEPDKPIKINLASPAEESIGSKSQTRPRPTLPAKRTRGSRPKQQTSAFPWFIVIAIVSAAVCVAAFIFISRKSHPASSTEQNDAQTAKSQAPGNGQPRPPSRLDPKLISVEVGAHGLQLCGAPIGRENFLTVVFGVLGAPTRTNEIEKADQVIYAFDACGLLIYSPKTAGNYSLFLDFDASDGATGTKNPFIGTFKVNEQTVGADTTAIALALIKELGLQAPTSASGIFRAQYANLDFVFGYLKSPERLSLVEIDFK